MTAEQPTPKPYDFPARVRTPGAAQREIRKLTRSLDTTTARREAEVAGYLRRRIARAQAATRHFRDLADITA